jgi:uncharacterized membrane protein
MIRARIGRRRGRSAVLQRLFLCLAVTAAIMVSTSSASFAQFKVCNQSSVGSVDVAFGLHHGRSGWESDGWYTIGRGECAILVGQALHERYYYLYGVSGDTVWNGDDEDTGSNFCIRPGAVFKLNVDSLNDAGDQPDCENHGYVTKTFFQVDTEDATDYIFNLTD